MLSHGRDGSASGPSLHFPVEFIGGSSTRKFLSDFPHNLPSFPNLVSIFHVWWYFLCPYIWWDAILLVLSVRMYVNVESTHISFRAHLESERRETRPKKFADAKQTLIMNKREISFMINQLARHDHVTMTVDETRLKFGCATTLTHSTICAHKVHPNLQLIQAIWTWGLNNPTLHHEHFKLRVIGPSTWLYFDATGAPRFAFNFDSAIAIFVQNMEVNEEVCPRRWTAFVL